ncbi:MAG: Rieske 2Fe-2S domain-containing protein [Cyanobacteria bacterium NC_groundwater_1444_Ag_S-0.65um_54_12]|nr:Rieske 2Fe-2S domain-containing protein [Cyanobacteria bacterium NC_groundwater_1444_Ag_S-0.65um_54_12]
MLILPVEGELLAIHAYCPHEGISLAKAPLVAPHIIECPEHNNRYDLRSGELKGYRVEIRAGKFCLIE